MFVSDSFKQYFGNEEHTPREAHEMQQLCLLHFEAKTTKEISDQLMARA